MAAEELTLWQRINYTRLHDAVRGRFDASLDWRLLVTQADLPHAIEDAITQVLRSTRLWRNEKLDVAADLVAHFQDGLEAGCSSTDLVKSFGDLQYAAATIRRAKKRGRLLLWHLYHYTLLTLTVLMAGYIAVGIYLLTGKPLIKTDYLSILNSNAVTAPENEQAWPLYRDAMFALSLKPVELDYSDRHPKSRFSKPGDADWPETQRFLDDHAGAIAQLREAAGRQQLGFVAATSYATFSAKDRELFGVAVDPQETEAAKHQSSRDQWLVSTLLPYLSMFRPAASLLASDSYRAALAGDGEGALNDIVALYRISGHCQAFPSLVSQLTAAQVQRQARTAIRHVLRDHPSLWTKDQIRDLAHQIAFERIDWRQGLASERACFDDVMQRLYTDDGNGDGRLALRITSDHNVFEMLDILKDASDPQASTPLSNGCLATLAMPAANLLVASRKEMTDMYQQFYALALEQIDEPFLKVDQKSTEEELEMRKTDPLGTFRYVIVNLMSPSYETVRNRIATQNGEQDGVLIGLALELYHDQLGKWPKALDELVPRWLPKLPVDRISGEPLHYAAIDDRPVVYGVGVDGDDDGGQAPDIDALIDYESAASPLGVSTQSEISPERNGDWVIWSTVKN